MLAIAENHYGAGTRAITAFLEDGKRIPWFPTRARPSDQDLDLAERHLDALATFYPTSTSLPRTITWLSGSLGEFDQLWPADGSAEGWGDPIGPTPWGLLLRDLHLDILKVVEQDEALRSLVGPPLWPVAGELRFISEALYEAPPSGELRAGPRWSLMEHVQHNFWRLLEWALVWPDNLERSPFLWLFRLHQNGLYIIPGAEKPILRGFYRTQPAA
jgi:hypothetical protein